MADTTDLEHITGLPPHHQTKGETMPELFIDIYDGYARWVFNGKGFHTSGSDPMKIQPSEDGFDTVANVTRAAFTDADKFPTDYIVHTVDHTV